MFLISSGCSDGEKKVSFLSRPLSSFFVLTHRTVFRLAYIEGVVALFFSSITLFWVSPVSILFSFDNSIFFFCPPATLVVRVGDSATLYFLPFHSSVLYFLDGRRVDPVSA